MGTAHLFFKRFFAVRMPFYPRCIRLPRNKIAAVLPAASSNRRTPMPFSLAAAEASYLSDIVAVALAEDVGAGDLTAQLIAPTAQAQATVITREPAVICGQPWVEETFRQLDTQVEVEWAVAEGAQVAADTILCALAGPARALLTGERTAGL